MKNNLKPPRLALILMLCAASAVSAQTKAFTTIDFPGASTTLAWSINKHGDMVGVYNFADLAPHGFLLSGGHFTSIDYPGATSTHSWINNDSGDIMGDYTVKGVQHGYILTQGRFITVDIPSATASSVAGIDGKGEILMGYNLADNSGHVALIAGGAIKNLDYPNATSTLANTINSSGDIVGNYSIGGVTHGFLASKGKFASIDVAGAAFTGAYGINTAGTIVGRYRDAAGVTHGFVQSGGAFTTIDIAGATATAPAGINDAGDIVGRYTASGVIHGFLLTSPSVRYHITDLGTLPGGSFSQASQGATNNGLIAGVSDVADGSQHATLWQFGQAIDLATPGLGGSNSIAVGLNKKGQVVGAAETLTPDDEDFCGYGTGLQCLPFWWQNGEMTPLATLGGKNGAASTVNSHGEAVGLAETAIADAKCHAPQRFDFEAVVWGPKQGQIRELHPLPGDTVGIAFWINDKGQVTGLSGTCDNTLNSGVLVGPHAVLWEKDGTAVNLGSLGGTVDISLFAVGNRGIYINNLGQVVGASALPGNKTSHAFLWTKEAGIKDLGVLPGDGNSGALGMNERGEVVGVSNDKEGNPRAFLWRNGVMTDLNTMVPADSPLYLLFAAGINEVGEISGFGVTKEGDVRAFVATPEDVGPGASADSGKQRPVLSERTRGQIQQRMGRHGLGVPEGR